MKQHFTTERYDNHFIKPPIVALAWFEILAVYLKNYQKLSTYITGINGLKDCRSESPFRGFRVKSSLKKLRK